MKLENKTTITTRTILYSLGIGSDEYSHKHRMERNEKKKRRKKERIKKKIEEKIRMEEKREQNDRRRGRHVASD